MSARPVDMSVLLLVDPQTRRIALARRGGALDAPSCRLERSDGLAPGPTPRIAKARLGAEPVRAVSFMDAALRALYEELGQLIARPAYADEDLPALGAWGRLARHRLAPDRTALTYLGRLIDPADRPTRRHARVFAASIAKVSNSIKRRGRAERIVWTEPEAIETATRDPALAPFTDMALRALGGRPRPLMVQFRAGQRHEVRL